MSWGGPDYSESLKHAIEEAGRQGVLVVAAAGNDGRSNDDIPFYPASYASYNIISVLATNNRDQIAWPSNYGPASVDVGEPGEGVISTLPMDPTGPMAEEGVPTEYGELSGTSVAGPHVSGACALLWSRYPGLSPYHIKHALLQTTDKVLPGLCLTHGRLNVARALQVVPQGQPGAIINTRDPNHLYISIQAAIDACNDDDTVIVAPGIYSGDGNRDIDFNGKAITIRSTDPNDPNIIAATIINCDGTMEEPHRGFKFASGEGPNSVVAGLTITNGYGPQEPFYISTKWHWYSAGGAIFCEGSSPTIENCNIIANSATVADGICCLNSSPIISNCSVIGDPAHNIGGGIFLYDNSSAVISNCIITCRERCQLVA